MKKKSKDNWKHIGREIEELVQRVYRLRPDHRDPHRFHEEKSEIAFELSQLAKRVA